MIWLIGCKGMLGTEVSNLFTARSIPFVGTDRSVDITKLENLKKISTDLYTNSSIADLLFAPTGLQPLSAIVNCAAYTAVDASESNIEAADALNRQGPLNIAQLAHSLQIPFLHISTDYVFDGTKTQPYREEDPTSPTGVYGKTKREGELAALNAHTQMWILRTAWLYGAHGNNFVHTMLRLMAEKTELKVVNDQKGSPTWAYDLASAIAEFVAPKVLQNQKAPAFGIYHFTNLGETTWYNFAQEIQKLGQQYGKLLPTHHCAILPCTSAEFPSPVRRPAYSVLDKTKIAKTLSSPIPDWQKSLKSYFETHQ